MQKATCCAILLLPHVYQLEEVPGPGDQPAVGIARAQTDDLMLVLLHYVDVWEHVFSFF